MSSMLLKGAHRDRWLLSYADFITVLFAVFVLMFVAAKAKEHTGGPYPGAGTGPMPGKMAGHVQQPSNLLSDLQKMLAAEQKDGVVTVAVDQRGIVIALDDKLCFRAGQADIEPAAVPMFVKVGQVLARHGTRVLLEGHTDSVPIHNTQFRSNWELSTARSIAVMDLMQRETGIPGQRFLIGGSADNAPLSTNQTEQGRAHNRRVEIVVIDAPDQSHPAAVPPV